MPDLPNTNVDEVDGYTNIGSDEFGEVEFRNECRVT